MSEQINSKIVKIDIDQVEEQASSNNEDSFTSTIKSYKDQNFNDVNFNGAYPST